MPWDIPYVIDADGNVTDEYIYMSGKVRPDNGGTWWTQNPSNVLHTEQYNYSKSHGDSLTGDLQLNWNVTPWLTLTSMNRYDTSNSYYEYYADPRTYDAYGVGSLTNSDGEWSGWGTTDLAKFHKSLGDHEINATVGWEYGEGYSRSLSAEGTNFPLGQRSLSNSVMSAIAGADYDSRSWAWLAQAQYSYLGKYVATASIRYDESYKFGPNNRGGYFPGVSAAWIISREKFLENNKLLTFLKVRGGYGKTGNDNIPAFQYQDTFSLSGQYNGVKTAILERMANPNLGWEEAYMTSFGIDATLKNNWNITVDLYHTLNSKILLQSPMPPSTGFFAVMDNVGKVRNMGVELAVDGAIVNRKEWSWTAGINLGLNQNRVLELPDGDDIVMNRGDVNQIIREGEDVYSWYMPKWLGVDSETGLPMWEKINEDGSVETVNLLNQATQQIVGVASPAFSGGLNTNVRWKNLTLSASGNFVVGNKIYNKNREQMDSDGAYTGLNQMSIDNGLGWSRWEQPGDNATHPELLAARSDGANGTSSRYLEDGSFFRLRNVTLSYNLPKAWIQKVRMSDARIYVSGDNILTLSKFSGMDPEVRLDGDTYHHAGLYASNYPVPLSVVFGIDIKF